MAYPHVDFPITVSLTSQLFDFTPVASNSSSGWVPSCVSSDCATTATWSTTAINSTLRLTFWGWDVALEGSIQGDMDVRFLFDGQEINLNPSNDTLFHVRNLDNLQRHSMSLKILNASADALLNISQARINASTLTDLYFSSSQYTLHSNDDAFSYDGFVQRTSAAGLASPTTYASYSAGDKVSLLFNGSAALIYGPCGPSNGLMRVTIDGQHSILNTSKPIQADDCLLFQSKGLSRLYLHQLEIENVDGGELHINRMEFMTAGYSRENKLDFKAGVAAAVVTGIIMMVVLVILMCPMRSSKSRARMKKLFSDLCS